MVPITQDELPQFEDNLRRPQFVYRHVDLSGDGPLILWYSVLEQSWRYCILGKIVVFADFLPLLVGPVQFDAAQRATGWVPTIPPDVRDTCCVIGGCSLTEATVADQFVHDEPGQIDVVHHADKLGDDVRATGRSRRQAA